MSATPDRSSTALLADPVTQEDWLTLAYDELHRRAHWHRLQRDEREMSTTSLVHDTVLRLVRRPGTSYNDRDHFFAVSTLAMRQVLMDHARRRLTRRRAGEVEDELPDRAGEDLDTCAADLLALDSALEQLRQVDPRAERVVGLHFFLELTFEEIAESLSISIRTVHRDWQRARCFLYRAMAPMVPGAAPEV